MIIPRPTAFIDDIIIIVLSLIFAAIFKKYFSHIYRTGHDNLIKSFVWGGVSAFIFFIFLMLVVSRSSETGGLVKLIVLLFPFMAVGFSTGSALLLGIIGLGGGATRYLAILIVGGAVLVADQAFPFIGKTIFRAVFFYGMGATVLSFFTPVQEESADFSQNTGGASAPEDRPGRLSLKGDITPIIIPKKDPGEE